MVGSKGRRCACCGQHGDKHAYLRTPIPNLNGPSPTLPTNVLFEVVDGVSVVRVMGSGEVLLFVVRRGYPLQCASHTDARRMAWLPPK